VWKVCIARRISPARNFDVFYIITIKFFKSLARNFQTFQSGSCDCPITLVLHEFFPQSSHFNLLETDGDCCSAPTPENSNESVFIDLVDPLAYMDELISSQVNKPTVLVSNPVEDKTSSVQSTVNKSNTMNMLPRTQAL
jgi:hypothetical protein